MAYNVAIDGPSGAGKSSIAKAVAKRMGFIHVDTGAMYRAIGYYALQHDCLSEESILLELANIEVTLALLDGVQHVYLNGEDVSGVIRTSEVSMAASKVSAIGAVREKLLNLQRRLGETEDILMDGRDIATVVLPYADLKIFLTASAEERAKRRYHELKDTAECPSYEQILADIVQRDKQDRERAIAPLMQAPDAILMDTTSMSFAECVDFLCDLITRSREE